MTFRIGKIGAWVVVINAETGHKIATAMTYDDAIRLAYIHIRSCY